MRKASYKAAIQDYTPAEINLGLMYQYGLRTDINKHKAGEWYSKAVQQGSTTAAYLMSQLNTQVSISK